MTYSFDYMSEDNRLNEEKCPIRRELLALEYHRERLQAQLSNKHDDCLELLCDCGKCAGCIWDTVDDCIAGGEDYCSCSKCKPIPKRERYVIKDGECRCLNASSCKCFGCYTCVKMNQKKINTEMAILETLLIPKVTVAHSIPKLTWAQVVKGSS